MDLISEFKWFFIEINPLIHEHLDFTDSILHFLDRVSLPLNHPLLNLEFVEGKKYQSNDRIYQEL